LCPGTVGAHRRCFHGRPRTGRGGSAFPGGNAEGGGFQLVPWLRHRRLPRSLEHRDGLPRVQAWPAGQARLPLQGDSIDAHLTIVFADLTVSRRAGARPAGREVCSCCGLEMCLARTWRVPAVGVPGRSQADLSPGLPRTRRTRSAANARREPHPPCRVWSLTIAPVYRPGWIHISRFWHAAANDARYPPSPWPLATGGLVEPYGPPVPVESSTSRVISTAYLPNVLTCSYLRAAAQKPARWSGLARSSARPSPTPASCAAVIWAAPCPYQSGTRCARG
jgi:hypothetical protein